VAGSDNLVTVSASVGIAVGPRTSVDELLRDADLALYAAKAAGKDRYMLFRPGLEVIGGVAAESRSLVAEPQRGA
jgi:predicted signal transduction protein with EAL and GGDEF domain